MRIDAERCDLSVNPGFRQRPFFLFIFRYCQVSEISGQKARNLFEHSEYIQIFILFIRHNKIRQINLYKFQSRNNSRSRYGVLSVVVCDSLTNVVKQAHLNSKITLK